MQVWLHSTSKDGMLKDGRDLSPMHATLKAVKAGVNMTTFMVGHDVLYEITSQTFFMEGNF